MSVSRRIKDGVGWRLAVLGERVRAALDKGRRGHRGFLRESSEWLRWFRLELLFRRFDRRHRRLLARARAAEEQYSREQKPLITVFVPTYNRGEIVARRTIPSVLQQTYQNIEVIVMGDGCTDDTGPRIVALGDARVRYHNMPEHKVFSRDAYEQWMSSGIATVPVFHEMAKGMWVAYLNDADYWPPEHLETMLGAALEGDHEIVYGRYRYEDSPGVWKTGGRWPFPTGRIPFRTGGVPISTILYRAYLRFIRESQISVPSWRYRVPGDGCLWHMMARAGVRAGFVDSIQAYMPLRPGCSKRRGQLTYEQRGSGGGR